MCVPSGPPPSPPVASVLTCLAPPAPRPPPSVSAQDGAGRTPLFCACATNRLECLLYLLEIDDQAIDTPDVRGDTPMHAACCNGFANCVEILLQSAADVSLRNAQVRGCVGLGWALCVYG